MKVIKLGPTHYQQLKIFFDADSASSTMFNFFCDSYIENLKSFHAFGMQAQDGGITAIASFYESFDDASWYLTNNKCIDNNYTDLKLVMDELIRHNEHNGRLKFFCKVPIQFKESFNDIILSDFNRKRYGFFDEFLVKAKNQPKYTLAWQVLFNRTLLENDNLIRCFFLQKEHRGTLIDMGNI